MTQTTIKDNEYISISLSPLFIVLKREYKIILSITSFFLIIGIFYLLNVSREYTATSKIMPEVSYKASNGMAGIYDVLKKYNSNIDLYNTEITSSELYAEILKTNDFYEYILKKEVTTNTNKKTSFKLYYDSILENKSIFFGKGKSYSSTNIQDIQKRIAISTAKKNNLILVTVNLPDPSVAADIANFTTTYLIDYITKYRTEKARQKLKFIENLQKDVSKDSAKSEDLTKEIQENLIALTVQMKIQIQEDTPVFQILEKAQSSVNSSEPSVPSTLAMFIFAGLLAGVIISFLKNGNYKMLLNSN
ncbi:MAG: Wzz/FepE/Etk N-terminal domain-containing protein [Flavobacterium circumlabens]|uniref:Wzz/FepE/Etk N-terminal domain-containing protein n=1 Tax=Flavobacterium circumlabens TaxID=2133765 RepID=UPI003262F4F5